MTEEYTYRPPLKYLFIGISGLAIGVIFGMAISTEDFWISVVMGFFCLVTLATGIGFLIIFFRKFDAGNLKLGNDFIEIPGRWNKRIRLNFDEIADIGEFNTYDNVIELESKEGIHLIERSWMKQSEFEKVKKKLQELRNSFNLHSQSK